MAGGGEEIPGLFGSGPNRHPSAAVRFSMASQALHHEPTPDVAAFLASMHPSPNRAPTELSVHRSSVAYSSNPIRSALPTRSNSISGAHTAPINGTYPTLPNSSSLQQTRFFQTGTRPAQPLSTIHSERSLHSVGADTANAPPASRQTWMPQSAPASTSRYGYGAPPMANGYMDGNISTEMLRVNDQSDTVSFQESGGEALVPADNALFRSHRPANERLHWHFDSNNDESVSDLLNWVQVMSHGLATLAVSSHHYSMFRY
jgi:hypothetical protein